jgi:hypothetical protein
MHDSRISCGIRKITNPELRKAGTSRRRLRGDFWVMGAEFHHMSSFALIDHVQANLEQKAQKIMELYNSIKDSAGVETSHDNGNNWTAINTGLTDLTIFDLELNDNYIIAATNTQGVFRFALSNLNLSTDISDFDVKNAISLFPNPTTHQINVKADYKIIGTAYTIYDNLGKAILSGLINYENTIIEIGNLTGGIYTLSIGENKKQVFKIIKQ